jgi:hypothetical protein
MELLTASTSSNENPIPVMGIESSEDSLSAFMTEPSGESLNEYSDEHFYRTAELAYYRAEARGFEPGHEMEDWLAAESEVNQ